MVLLGRLDLYDSFVFQAYVQKMRTLAIQVLYFQDSAPEEIPPFIFKGFEKVEWSKYGCVLAGFARWGSGEAVLEIKGPSNVHLQIVVHCYLTNILRYSASLF